MLEIALTITVILISSVVINRATFAEETVSGDCIASFPINPNKIVNINGSSLMCGVVDQMRLLNYESFTKNNSTYIINNINNSMNEIENLNALLEKESYTSEHSQLALATFLKTVSMIGLESCIPTSGGGCIVAAIGFVGSAYAQFDSVVDYAEKEKQLTKLKERLSYTKKNLIQHKSQLPNGYNQAVNNFNEFCQIIKQKCR